MSDSANITSVEAVTRFLSILRDRRDRAADILSAHSQEMRRVLEWFERELPFMWNQELRRRYDRVSEKRTEYENCKLRAMKGERKTCFEEKKAYDKARYRLREAEEKIDVIARWRTKFGQEAEETRGRLGKFQNMLDGDVERTIALLERMIDSLEAYLGRTLPTEEQSE